MYQVAERVWRLVAILRAVACESKLDPIRGLPRLHKARIWHPEAKREKQKAAINGYNHLPQQIIGSEKVFFMWQNMWKMGEHVVLAKCYVYGVYGYYE